MTLAPDRSPGEHEGRTPGLDDFASVHRDGGRQRALPFSRHRVLRVEPARAREETGQSQQCIGVRRGVPVRGRLMHRPHQASSSIGRPRSTSSSIEVLNAPSSRVTSCRASGCWSTRQPIRSPTSPPRASPPSETEHQVVGHHRSLVALVSAATGFVVNCPRACTRCPSGSAETPHIEARLAQQIVHRCEARRARAVGLADDQARAVLVHHQPGLGRGEALRMNDAAHDMRAAVWLGRPRRRGRRCPAVRRPHAESTPCTNHHGTPFIAGSTIV